jgi:hypothetical protein
MHVQLEEFINSFARLIVHAGALFNLMGLYVNGIQLQE